MPVHLEDTKELILERSPIHVNSVEKPSLCTLPFEDMKDFTLERSPINVNIVVKSFLPHTLENMKGLTLKRSSRRGRKK